MFTISGLFGTKGWASIMMITKTLAIITMLFAMICSSSARSFEKRLEKFVRTTEQKYEKYSKEDWEQSMKEYQAFLDEYKQNYDSFSKEEKDKINQQLGKYSGILLKQGLSKAGVTLQEVIESTSSFMKGLLDSIGALAPSGT